jgi:hypothetical protein
MCDLIVVERIMTLAMSTLHPIENGAIPLGEGQLLIYQIFVAQTFCCNLNIVQYCTFNMSYAGEELLVLGLKLGKMVLKEMLLGFIHNLHRYW